MKNNHTCPKCGSRDIFIIIGHNMPTGSSCIPVGIFSYVPVDRYVCANCGFIEEWINEEDIGKAKRSDCSQDF